MTAVEPRHGADQFFEYDPTEERRPKKKKKKAAWWVLGSMATLVILALIAAGAYLFSLQRSFNDNVTHFPGADPNATGPDGNPVLPSDEERPEDTDATNILLLGTDAGGGSGEDEDLPRVPGGARSDTMMLVHIPESRDSMQVISIPRDLWVEIPGGRGWHKVNAGLALGGDQGHWLAVNTVEQLLDTRIDHVAAVDMQGFTGLVDTLGGVTVNSSYSESFTTNEGYTFNPGTQRMDSDQALSFVRHRASFGDGDLQRIRNQQAFIRGVLNGAASPSNFANPVRTNEMVSTFASHLMTDPDFTATTAGSLAWDSRDALDNIQFMTLPTAGSGYSSDGQWIWHQDEAAQAQISEHLRNGTLEEYLSD